jgi:hypothetical protein
MDAWIINLDQRPDRWAAMQARCRRVGVTPRRWAATPDNGQSREWSGRPVPDVSRRQAINDSYQSLLAHLDDVPGDGWLVLQDDVTFHCPPDRPKSPLIHIYGGWRVLYHRRTRRGLEPLDGSWHLIKRPLRGSHICPQAFWLPRPLLPQLAEVWRDDTRQVCETWMPLLRRHATIETTPTIEPDVT